MRFDFVPVYSAGEPLAWDQIARNMREESLLAEDAGFEGVWFGEHHFATPATDNGGPNPLLLCADIAARTKRIRVGTIPAVIVDYHPLRLAEDVATVDRLTEGRLDFGAGRGVNDRTSIQFNVNAGRADDDTNYALFCENLEVMVGAWTQEAFRHEGRFWTFPVPGWREHNAANFPLDRRYFTEDAEYTAIDVRPKPYQRPHPPVWIASDKRRAYEYAGEHGLNMLSWAVHRGRAAENWTAFREASARAGRHLRQGQNIGVMQTVYVARTMEEAIADTRHGVNELWTTASGGGLRPDGWSRAWWADHGEDLSQVAEETDWFDFLQPRDRVWIGTPEYVAERIARYRDEIGLDHLIVWPQLHHLSHAKVMRMLELFATEVTPLFREEGVRAPQATGVR